MRSVEQLIAGHPFFVDLDEETVRHLAGCALNRHFDADEYLFRADDPAETFFLLRGGSVAIEIQGPGERRLIVETQGPGSVVGLSWLFPPYRHSMDARALSSTSAVALDAGCLREKCDQDPRVGYLMLQRLARAMHDRMMSARVRLLDLYGAPSAR
ncbi:MAG TPA: cyclic nucleotide-binding domain-containing protein [Actinomycetes bacterium]|nr:cyclic nucleotide-binding domain-containing protein [Actinomycetes bacterium]